MYKHHIISGKSILVVMTDGTTKSVTDSNKKFPKIKKALVERQFDIAVDLINNINKVKIKTKQIFTMKGDNAYYKDEKLPSSISKILRKFVDNNIPATAVINFWNLLKKNPSKFAKEELYLFLEANGIPLCEDGHFIVYKKIREDYKDCHSRTFDNHPGKVLEMKREKVCSDRSVCNAQGFHVCSWSYLSSFSGERTVECKVNPADVVSIPEDYGNAKMRVWKYEVIKEITGQTEANSQVLYDECVLQKKSKNRIIIPASFLHKMNCKEGNVVSVVVSEGQLVLLKGIKGNINYTVDGSSNIRIAQSILEKAVLFKNKNYKLYYNTDENKLYLVKKENTK